MVAELPETYAKADREGVYRPLAWWESFEDPVLSAFVEEAIEENRDLRQAVARIAQARARSERAEAGLFPQASAGAEASYIETGSGVSQNRRPGGGSAAGGGQRLPAGRGETGGPSAFEEYGGSLMFSYELDFWSRIRDGTRAADAELAATVGEARTVLLSVISETMLAYFDLVALEQRLDLTRGIIDILEERSSLTERRFRRGLADSFELYSIEEQLRVLQGLEPQLEARMFAARARLASLTANYPQELLERADRLVVRLPARPIEPGLPAELLIQRPDVRASWLRLEAARLRVGVARAQLFPQVTLSASAGTQAESIGGLSEAWYASLVGSLTQPIFTGGRIRADISEAEARMAEAAAAYGQTVLTAMREAETALREHEASLTRYQRLREELRTANASADLERRRVERGVGTYVSYLDARRNALQARRDVVDAERALAEARLSVHRALGGVWTQEGLAARSDDLVAAVLGEDDPEVLR